MSFALLWKKLFSLAFATSLIAVMGCTQAVTKQIDYLPANDSIEAGFEAGEEKVERKSVPVDILWVIDNSDSMSTSQDTLRKGLAGFARKFLLKEGTDIQMAVITTDAFIANEAWQSYLNTAGPSKKTPKEYAAAVGLKYGRDYAKISASDLMRTKANSSGLVAKFENLVSVGTKGLYEEHGFGSVLQFIADNEKGSSKAKLFRPNSQRIIVFLSDENDQSIEMHRIAELGSNPKLLYRDSYYTGKDVAKADAKLPAHFTIDCPESVVEGETLAPMSICVRSGFLMPVERFKSELDGFFRDLDGVSRSSYFVASIVAKNLATVKKYRAKSTEKVTDDPKTKVITHERGDRYIQLADQVGNGSFSMDIDANSYTPVLDQIGLEIEKRYRVPKFVPTTTFVLERAPNPNAKIFVILDRVTGGRQTLDPSQYSIKKNVVTLTDEKLISSLKLGDRIRVNYQPSSVLPAKK